MFFSVGIIEMLRVRVQNDLQANYLCDISAKPRKVMKLFLKLGRCGVTREKRKEDGKDT